jgi:hypothetical protein
MNTYIKIIYIATGATLLFIAAMIIAFHDEEYPTSQALIKAINSGDIGDVLQVINSIKKLRYENEYSFQNETLPLVIDLWDIRIDKYPELNWILIKKDITRIELADIITQAVKLNHLLDLDTNEIHAYLRQIAALRNPALSGIALLYLAPYDDPDDALLALDIAQHSEFALFTQASGCLNLMCNKTAAEFIDKLTKTSAGDKLEYLQYLSEKRHAVREIICK